MTPVVIESPFAGCVPLNKAYLQACIRDCLQRDETPYASHQMLTDALDDTKPEERELGMRAGFDFQYALVLPRVFYVDLGWSSGMQRARNRMRPDTIRERRLHGSAWPRVFEEAGKRDPRFLACYSEARAEVDPHMPFCGLALTARDLYLRKAGS